MPKPMSKTQKANAAAQAAVSPKISPEWFDRLVRGSMIAEAVEDASGAFKKALTERALELKSALPKIINTLGLLSKVKPTQGNWTCREEAIMGTSIRVELWHEEPATGEAALDAPVLPKSLTRFRMPWKWESQPVVLQSRAWDEAGNRQPTRDEMFAERGAPRVTVAERQDVG